jgi:hypothetical protein
MTISRLQGTLLVLLVSGFTAMIGCASGGDDGTEPPPVVTPTVSSVSPNSGPTEGGTSITISGTNFEAVPTVTVGGVAATGVSFSSSTSITATTPAHAAGAVSVVVTNPGGQSGTLTNGFTYEDPAPTVASVTPNSGPTEGGTSVTIAGTNFEAVPSVTFGGVAATGVSFASSTSITATTPANAEGAVDVVVTNPGGQSGTLSNGFTYEDPAPTVTSVEPNSGLTEGGTDITITGTNFAPVPTVTIGGVPATDVAFASSTSLQATTPAHAAGPVDVVVTNPDGKSGTLTNGFTYGDPAPTVTTVDPNEGGADGGYTVTITGTDFVAVPTVTFGGTPATTVSFTSSTSIIATVPAHAPGPVDVVVTNPDGQSGTLANGFTYIAPPSVTSVTPNTGSTSGGADVTVTGTDFVQGATVTFGGDAADPVAFISSTELLATVPPHAAGPVDVVVTNPDGQSGTLANGFTYLAPTQLSKSNWQVDLLYQGGSFRLEVFFTQTGDMLQGTNRDNNAELDVMTQGLVVGSQVTLTFTLSNGGSARGVFTCTGTILSGPPQTISGTFTADTLGAGTIGGSTGSCEMQ